MKGKISFSIKNRHIAFKMELERNITILTGDSGTGKTKLINMVKMYASEGKSSGITLRCKCSCIVLEGNYWETLLYNTHESIVFVEESTKFMSSYAFANAIQNTDNYYVFVTREPLPQIPYSIESIKQIIKNGQKPKIEKIYPNVSVKDISSFPYDAVIVEDSGAGFTFFKTASEKWGVNCFSANGKSNILLELRKQGGSRILVVADAAAFGSEIMELTQFKDRSDKKIDFFFPESFEWLILKSAIFSGNVDIGNILKNPIDFIESEKFISWERYFTHLLVETTKDSPKLRYPKAKGKLPPAYTTDANMDYILSAMK